MRHILFVSVPFLLWSSCAFAAEIKAINPDSPEFLLGKATYPNLQIGVDGQPGMKFMLGIRLMGTAEIRSPSDDRPAYDFYDRRVRLEAGFVLSEKIDFKMDLRNDRVNQGNSSDASFAIGRAHLSIRRLFNSSLLNIRALRAKVDVSRAETVSSAQEVNYDRPFVADFAAIYVSENRLATNFQIAGDWKKKIHYSLAIGDGVGSVEDAVGNSSSIDRQLPMWGGKVILSPISGWEETARTETYFGRGKHLALGLGHFRTSHIRFGGNEVNHGLTNVELSGHYLGTFAQFEYFLFEGMAENLNASSLSIGTGRGWYVTTEHVFEGLAYLAPFARYEDWQKFGNTEAYHLKSTIVGVNWYLLGNTFKVGYNYSSNRYGGAIGGRHDSVHRITSQLHF